jgi:hypothetical protein
MDRLTLAYRDDDRTPVIFAIREMAKRHYSLDVNIIRIKDGAAYEAALFNGAADVIIEHLEYLYDEAAKGKKVLFFCAPSKGGGLDLVVRPDVQRVEELRDQTIAVRAHGQPHAVTLWLRMLGLENDVATVIVHDRDVGRWGQWKKVAGGECAATFMSPLYLPEALAAGLKVLEVPEIPIVGHFAQACLAAFARNNDAVMRAYVQSVLHALVWLTHCPGEALAALGADLKRSMEIADDRELKRRFDAVVGGLKIRPYPTPHAIANTCEIAVIEYPEAKGFNPLTLWDLHWVKDLDDSGFIDGVVQNLSEGSGS